MHVLAAVVAIDDREVFQQAIDALTSEEPRFPTVLLIQILRRTAASSEPLRRELIESKLYSRCVGELERTLAAPPRRDDDGSLEPALDCTCDDCVELIELLRSPAERARDWPLNKERRRHLHGRIDATELPVSHTTLRRGSPHVLQLRKLPILFEREAAHREELSATLRELRGLEGPPGRPAKQGRGRTSKSPRKAPRSG